MSDALAALARVRRLLIDQTRLQACPCGSEALIRPDDLARALRGKP